MASPELAVPRALSACINCATGRRKCDRLLPSCSRCSRPGSSRPCAYNECSLPSVSGRQGVSGLTAETTPPPLGRGPGACVRCRTVKRRCDRGLPSCSRCEKSGVFCAYAADAGAGAPLGLQSWTALPMNTQGYLNSASGGSNIYETYYGLLDCARTLALPQSNLSPRVLLGPALNFDFPVPDSDNVPELLYYFCSILPTAGALPNSLSIYVHTEWLRRAIANPCLLHSTLFCASAYLDSRQNANSPSSRTMFHHLQAVKIIREQLAQPNFQPSYEIAAAVLALSYFTMTSNDIESALVHIQGLARILHLSQNEGPDFKYLTALFSETLICFAVCLDRDITSIVSSSFTDRTVLPLLLLPETRPSSLLRRILAQSADDANSSNNRTGYKKHWPPTSYVMLEIQKVHDVIVQGEPPSSAPFPEEEPVHTQQQQRQQLNTVGSLLPEIPWISAYEDTTMEKATTCCYLTVRVFWGIVNNNDKNNSTESSTTTTQGGRTITASSPHHAAFETLKETLSKIDPIPWVQCAPELYAWVYFTAAAACDRDEDRKEIMIAAMRYLTGLNGVDLSLIREGWHYFRWLRGTRTRTLGI